MSPRKVALLEPNKLHARLIERECARRLPEWRIVLVKSPSELADTLAAGDFSVAVVDFSLAAPTLELELSFLRTHHPQLAIILLAPDVTDDIAEAARRFGCEDIIAKHGDFAVVLPQLIFDAAGRRRLSEVRFSPTGDSDQALVNLTRVIASTLAHEINNPLMSILGTVELLFDDLDRTDQETAHKLLTIQTSARRIHRAIKNLSSLADARVKSTPSGSLIESDAGRVLVDNDC